MNLEHYFFILFSLFATYVVIGNYLYLSKVLPALNKNGKNEHPSFMPSGQLKQIETYITILNEKNEKPWFYYLLKYNKTIVTILLMLFVSFMVIFWSNI